MRVALSLPPSLSIAQFLASNIYKDTITIRSRSQSSLTSDDDLQQEAPPLARRKQFGRTGWRDDATASSSRDEDVFTSGEREREGAIRKEEWRAEEKHNGCRRRCSKAGPA